MDSRADYVPPRWKLQRPLGNGINRWMIASPVRLLAWWALLASGVTCSFVGVIVAFLIDGTLLIYCVPLLCTFGLNLVVDAKYIPRAWSARSIR